MLNEVEGSAFNPNASPHVALPSSAPFRSVILSFGLSSLRAQLFDLREWTVIRLVAFKRGGEIVRYPRGELFGAVRVFSATTGLVSVRPYPS